MAVPRVCGFVTQKEEVIVIISTMGDRKGEESVLLYYHRGAWATIITSPALYVWASVGQMYMSIKCKSHIAFARAVFMSDDEV